ncbi:MAG: hypothetical protein AAF701_02730 [Pseudomonadota bacterium]
MARHDPLKSATAPRRVVDAAIIVPALGAMLVSVPMLWPDQNVDSGVRTSTAMIYLFSIWAIMICLAAILSRVLSRTRTSDD